MSELVDPPYDAKTCVPYITQDGYDSGQAFCCRVHEVYEPVIDDRGTQTYEVTLEMFEKLVAEHKKKFPDKEDSSV